MLTDRSPRRSRPGTAARAALLALAASLAACAGDRAPTAPAAPSSIPGAAVAAFQLTIDVASGRVTVGRPASSAQLTGGSGERPSLSLVGSDAVAVHATDCAFTAVPNSATKKRCTLSLAIENRLQYTDLVTATTFPRPPQGTNGILVFPFSAAALGVPGGSATPNADWDRAPANFFNDFSGCSGKASDCYRSELYAAPLYAGETSAARTVGFDVDKNAGSVSAYVVVAADLRDNPVQTVTILSTPSLDGMADEARVGDLENSLPTAGAGPDNHYRGFLSIDLGVLPGGISVASATLRAKQVITAGDPYGEFGNLIVDHLNYGPTLDFDDFSLPSITENIGTLSTNAKIEHKELDVTGAVAADLASARARSQYRLRFVVTTVPSENHFASFAKAEFEPDPANQPQLVIRYRAVP